MTSIAPTLTAETMATYNYQLGRIESFTKRVHIDLMDGKFAPTQSIRVDQVWWPGNMRADLHVMYKKPFKYTNLFVALNPQLVVVHAEASGDFIKFANTMHAHGIETGIALLPETPASKILPALDFIDHVLIFSGNLGHQGGSKANPELVPKIKELRAAKPSLEIGWDGGINDKNALALVRAGVDVLNVGGFIQSSDRPIDRYLAITRAVSGR